MSSLDMTHAVDALYANRNRFIIIGLTGRTGAGCSTVARILSKSADDIVGPNVTIIKGMDNESRKCNIIKDYARKNWQRFFVIKVRDIISTYLLEKEYDDAVKYIKEILPEVTEIDLKEIFNETKEKYNCLEKVLQNDHDNADATAVHTFISTTLNQFTNTVKDTLNSKSKDRCINAYQTIGDNIRLYGNAFCEGAVSGENIYSISNRINLIIKALRNYNKINRLNDYFVIDAFRNPIEVKFFQERYAGFYLWAINAPEEDRKDRLFNDDVMDAEEIRRVDEKEFSTSKILKGQTAFISQNISACIQAADVLLRNVGNHKNKKFGEVNDQVIKYISLIKRPGVVTPSRDERCMQLACVAKLNSGCISRQVGAAVADQHGYVRAIGWNDAPAGQTPCILKSHNDLLNNIDDDAYSDFERSDDKFIAKAKAEYETLTSEATKRGIHSCYCFKDVYNSISTEDTLAHTCGNKPAHTREDNQVHTRALHAEENAFLALISGYTGSIPLETLYTTSSPCVLCAKKAYQLGIKRIVYISPYPDISFSHILGNGLCRPTLELYSGALGSAYHRLYLPVVSHKDELRALAIKH